MFDQPPHTSPRSSQLMDKHTIDTPEQLQLDFAIAGIGSRFLAIAIDTAIQAVVLIGALLMLGLAGIGFAMGGASAGGMWFAAIAIFVVFLILYGYFAIFEILWNGQTPGKRSMGIRVIKESGRPLTAGETIGRNLMRIVDQLPGFYGVGIAAAILNSRNMRLGDMLTGAIVIRETSLAALRPSWQQAPAGPQEAMVGGSALSAEELALIDSFLNRRSELAVDVRVRMAGQILARLQTRLPIGEVPEALTETTLETLARERRAGGAG